jgi:hypothetical protein
MLGDDNDKWRVITYVRCTLRTCCYASKINQGTEALYYNNDAVNEVECSLLMDCFCYSFNRDNNKRVVGCCRSFIIIRQ